MLPSFSEKKGLLGIRGIIYEGVARTEAENKHGVQAAWDDLNRVALEKMKFYVTTRVDDM